MLTLDLPTVDRGEERVQREIPPHHPLWSDAGVELLEPLRVDLHARPVGEGVLVRGTLRTLLNVACRRCLATVEWRVDRAVELLFEPLSGAEADMLEGEVYPLPERGSELDLGGLLREQLLLDVPMYVLCRDECRGLCAQCGADLNQAACDCVPEPVPGPWDALKTIKFD